MSLIGGFPIPKNRFGIVLFDAFAFLKGSTHGILGNGITSSCCFEFFLKPFACGCGNLIVKTSYLSRREARRRKGQGGADKNVS